MLVLAVISRVFNAFVFHVLSLLAMCTTVSFFMFFVARLLHLKRLLTYILIYKLIREDYY